MFTGIVFGLVMYSVASFWVCGFVVEQVVWIYWLVGLCYCCALVLARFVVRGVLLCASCCVRFCLAAVCGLVVCLVFLLCLI